MESSVEISIRSWATGIAAIAMSLIAACQTTTTPVNESEWLPKQSASAPVANSEERTGAQQKPAATAEAKPWDAPSENSGQSAMAQPTAQQLSEYLSGATWVKIDENGTRTRSLQLKSDGTFVAKSDGQSGELPAFDGLVVQAKGRWEVKSSELRLLPYFGNPVVVQLQWLGDKRIVMMNGDSWIRSQ